MVANKVAQSEKVMSQQKEMSEDNNVAEPSKVLKHLRPITYRDAPTAIHEIQTLLTSLQAPLKNPASKFIGNAYFTNTLAQLQNITTQLTALGTTKCNLQHVDMSSYFIYFPELPMELRQLVWHFALPVEQIVEVGWKHSSNSRAKSIKNHKLPVTLQICHESRAVATRWYQQNIGLHEQQEPFIGYSAGSDVIYLSCNDGGERGDWVRYRWNGLSHIAAIIPVDNIQHLALDTRMFRQWTLDRKSVHTYLQSLSNLKIVTIVVHADLKNGKRTCRSNTWWKERGLPTFAKIENPKINNMYLSKAKQTFTKIKWYHEADGDERKGQADGRIELRIRQCLRNGVPCCVVGKKSTIKI